MAEHPAVNSPRRIVGSSQEFYFVYVIRSLTTGRIYTGYTANLEKRISRHNSKLNIYTKNRGPWKLIYHELAPSRSAAMLREKYLKTGKGRKELSTLIEAQHGKLKQTPE